MTLDGQTPATAALDFAFAEAELRRRAVIALHAFPPRDESSDQRQRATIAEVLAGHEQGHPDIAVKALFVPGEPEDAIIEQSFTAAMIVASSTPPSVPLVDPVYRQSGAGPYPLPAGCRTADPRLTRNQPTRPASRRAASATAGGFVRQCRAAPPCDEPVGVGTVMRLASADQTCRSAGVQGDLLVLDMDLNWSGSPRLKVQRQPAGSQIQGDPVPSVADLEPNSSELGGSAGCNHSAPSRVSRPV